MELKKFLIYASTFFKNHNLATLPGTSFYTPENYFAFRLAHVDYDGGKVFKLAEAETLDQAFVENHCENLSKSVKCFGKFLETLK